MTPGDERVRRERIIAECELRGLAETKLMLAERRFAARKRPIIEGWIAEQEAPIIRSAAEADKSVDREIAREGNEIAREANQIARRANLIAVLAAIVAVAALIVAIVAIAG